METARRLLHIDMDAFFAAIEQRDNPAYRGIPLAVGGDPSQRGVVAAASYEARRYGICSAMSVRHARQRCPDLTLVRPRFAVYRAISQQLQEIFRAATPLVEPLALDEAYLDVSAQAGDLAAAAAIAQQLRTRIRQETGLTASAGVSVNKFLAKLASKRHKPDGLCCIAPEEIPGLVAALPIEDFPGIGPATAAKLHRWGVRSGADLRARSAAELVQGFGKHGRTYYWLARGCDRRPVVPNRVRKSVGAETTFAVDRSDLASLSAALEPLAQQVEQRLQACQRAGRTLTLKIKYADFRQVTRCRTRATGFASAAAIQVQGRELLAQHLEVGARVRLLGLAVSNLVEPATLAAAIAPAPQYVQLSLGF